MLHTTFLLKIGEIALKGGNRSYFENKLKKNIKQKFKSLPTTLYGKSGRYFLECEEKDKETVLQKLSTTFGIVAFTEIFTCNKTIDALKHTVVEAVTHTLSSGKPAESFKIEARRTDKTFSFTSYDIACILGDHIRKNIPGLSVDVKNPDLTVFIEIRENAVIYIDVKRGLGGLPVGSAGRGILLLSGGIDSPVAGFLMGKRGLNLDAVYFHSYPYTSEEAQKKVEQLATILAPYLQGLRLFIVPFTPIQLHIKQHGRDEETTLLTRAAMMKLSEMIGEKQKASCIVTGESLSQVASQTVESLGFTNSVSNLPVLRPLIGLDKQEIITLAQKIGTYETSILPYEDCCTIFSPKHPLIRPKTSDMIFQFEKLDLQDLFAEAIEKSECKYYPVNGGAD